MPAGTDRHRLRLAFEGVRDHGWFSPPGAGATATVKWSRTLPGKLGSNPAERRAGATPWLSSTRTRAARSEVRSVGKEGGSRGRTRWSPYNQKTKGHSKNNSTDLKTKRKMQ